MSILRASSQIQHISKLYKCILNNLNTNKYGDYQQVENDLFY